MPVNILAIESSCDDTSASIVQDGRVLSNCIANQEVHKEYGGVVPELASRAHQANIVPVVDTALAQAGIQKSELHAVAVTRGPGLLGSLLVGTGFAKAMALGMDIPIIEVDHLKAHVVAHFADEPKPDFPFLCLTVSGGHTQIILVKSPLEMELLGTTIDDAAGEAFDKAGKMLGLEYPAGPIIDKLAKEGEPVFSFPEPRIQGLNFSFSGLKTSILYFIRDKKKENPHFVSEHLNDLCASIQHRIVGILLSKLRRAAREQNIAQVAIAGGVSANSELRHRLQQMGEKEGWQTFIPAFEYCTDNAAMIGLLAYYKYLEGDFADQTLEPYTRSNM